MFKKPPAHSRLLYRPHQNTCESSCDPHFYADTPLPPSISQPVLRRSEQVAMVSLTINTADRGHRALRHAHGTSIKPLSRRLCAIFSVCRRVTTNSSNGDTTHTVALSHCRSLLPSGYVLTWRGGGGRSVLRHLAVVIGNGGGLSLWSLLTTDGAQGRWALLLLLVDDLVLLNIQLRLPLFYIVFTVVQNLASLCAVVVESLSFTGDHRTVIEELQ